MSSSSAIDVKNLKGKVMIFGDGMNTDIIIPSQYLEERDPKKYSKFVMAAVRPSTYDEVQKIGDVVFVGGEDFGSGSSREQAPDAIKYAGVKAVVAEKFASIFFRNCVNVGLPLLEVPDIRKFVDEMDEITVDLETGIVKNLSKNTEVKGKPIETFLLNKLRKGGLIPELQEYVKENNLNE